MGKIRSRVETEGDCKVLDQVYDIILKNDVYEKYFKDSVISGVGSTIKSYKLLNNADIIEKKTRLGISGGKRSRRRGKKSKKTKRKGKKTRRKGKKGKGRRSRR